MIQVEMAGQHPPQTFNIAPDEIRSLADIIYNQCVLGQRGSEGTVGGFITTQTTALKEWITAPTFDFSTPYRKLQLTAHPQRYGTYTVNHLAPETAYLTVSFSHPVPDWLSGGDNDPIMAFVLSDTALKAQDKAKPRTPLSRSLLQRAERFFDQGVRMEPRGQRIHWWELRPQLLQLPPLNVSASAIDLPSTENTTAANTATARRRRRDTKERTANPL